MANLAGFLALNVFAVVLAFVRAEHSSRALDPMGVVISALFSIKCQIMSGCAIKGPSMPTNDCMSLDLRSTTMIL
jgi:hypothetical protein